MTNTRTRQKSSPVVALLLILISFAAARRVDASEPASPSPRAESTSSAALARNPKASHCQPNETRDGKRIAVEGCLVGKSEDFPDDFSFSNYSGEEYDLLVKEPHLKKKGDSLIGRNVCVQGALSEAEESTIEVTSISALPKRVARLDPAIPPPSQWRERSNNAYGLSFRLPSSFPPSENDLYVDSNFPVEGGAVTLGVFAIKGNLVISPALPECDKGLNQFDGGLFVIFVNPQVTNRGACEQFGESNPENHAWHTFQGTKFSATTTGGGGLGMTTYGYDYYQTFQNGLCYEFVFANVEGAPIDEDPCRCTYPEGPRTEKLVQTILSQLSFHKPQSPTVISSQPETAPEIISFTASTTIADEAKNRGSVKFSWSTSNADFVRFSYRCTSGEEIIKKGLPSLGLDGIVIAEEGATSKGCGGKLDTPEIVNHSPNSSLILGFGNSEYDAPIVVRITLTPYSDGVAFAKSSKTIPITVNPSNPFSDGLPPPTGNIAFVSPASSASGYRQRSSAKIEWTDSNDDEHYWIHLVRDNSSGGLTYLYQIDGYLPRTGRSTSYTWTVPKSYSGSGFRIFINSGFNQRTYGVSPPFNIVP